MRTLIITKNIPEVVSIKNLREEISTQFSGLLVDYVLPTIWYNQDETTLQVERKVIIQNVPDNVTDDQLKDIVSAHKVYGSLTCLFDSCVYQMFGNDSVLASKKDYRKLRHDIMNYCAANPQSLTTEQIKEAARHFCVPQAYIDMFFSKTEQITNGKSFQENAFLCREDRFNGVVSMLFNHLEYEEAGEIITTLNDYIWKYTYLGVEGTTEGDVVGVFDYFTSTQGTIFENAGFLQKSWVPKHNLTLSQLADVILDILHNGYIIAFEQYLENYGS